MNETVYKRLSRIPSDRLVVWVVTIVSAPLFLYGLGNTFLWQDEGQTALLGRSVLAHGVPIVGDGPQSLSAHAGTDAGVGGLYLQIAWLQAYLTAGSFALFGESSWSARVPFAVIGWLCAPLLAGTMRRGGADPWAINLGATLTALSVPFIICARHARYYPLAAATVLMVIATYIPLARRIGDESVGESPGAAARFGRREVIAFGVASCLSVLSFDLTAVGILSAVALHWLMTAPKTVRLDPRFWGPILTAGVLLGGWVGLTLTAESRQAVGPFVLRIPQRLFYYIGQINAHIMPIPVFAALIALWGVRRRRPTGHCHGDLWMAGLLVVVVIVGTLAAVIAPSRFFRYIAPLIPVLLGLAAIGLAAVARRATWARVLVACLVVALLSSTVPFVWSHALLTQVGRASGIVTVRDREVPYRVPLVQLVGELRSPPRGPIAAVVDYLDANAQPGEVLVTTYGELPLKFHTDLVIYGGETAQLPPLNKQPDWVWPRHLGSANWEAVRAANAWLGSQVYLAEYQRIELPTFDRRWENREDPLEHIFSNPGPPALPVVLFVRPGR